MNDREIVKKIIENNSCAGIECSQCLFHKNRQCNGGSVNAAEQWLKEHPDHPEKVLITDKMIINILESWYENGKIDIEKIKSTKELLQKRGYEVEKPKSKLEEARDIGLLSLTENENKYYLSERVDLKISLYEEAIKELQGKQ